MSVIHKEFNCAEALTGRQVSGVRKRNSRDGTIQKCLTVGDPALPEYVDSIRTCLESDVTRIYDIEEKLSLELDK